MPAYSDALLADFTAELRPRLQGEVRADPMTRALYATDASMYQVMPAAVVLPRSAEDVQAALEAARRFRMPVLPRGGGSGLAGQAVGAGVVIDFSRHLNQVLALDLEARTAQVQPGLVLDVLSAALSTHGLMVGPDPASSNRATLGGMMANNATGTHSILYGNVINHIREANVLLADGSAARLAPLRPADLEARGRGPALEHAVYRMLARLRAEHADVIRRDTPRHWRRNSGYRLEYALEETVNPAQLLCGSEGTLGVITDLTIGLVPQPRRTALGVAHFRTRRESLLAVTDMLETRPSAIELLDGHALRMARLAPAFARMMGFVQGEPEALLITEYYGDTEAELRARLDDLERVLTAKGHGYALVRALAPPEIKNVWNVRKEGLGLIMSVKGDCKPLAFIEDASVPVEHLADYIDALVDMLERTGTPVAMYAHASAGTLHVRPFINTKDAADVAKMRDIAAGSMELVRRYGGAVSSEHGDGLARSWLNEALLGPELYRLHREVKATFDPDHLLNPGKIVDAPPMTEQLRMGPGYAVQPVALAMDWSEHGGFAAAVELCNGNGACRKTQSGTMCPSYMVTREEEHSTRGRANALRAALSGALPPGALTDARMFEVMALCVQCKGCKTECPSNVDLSRIKSEWLDKYWKAHPMPARTRLFAYMAALARTAPPRLSAASNWFTRRGAVRGALQRTLGISARRTLPAFAPVPFTDWFAARSWPEGARTVVLFADTFNNYNKPETAQAAAEFFHRTGHTVLVPSARACCGRTFISKGLLAEARRTLAEALGLLYPYAEQGLPIVGLEPSCILTFRDELAAFFPGDPRAARLAAATFTFEEYVAREEVFAGLRWKPAPPDVLLHGHCHQKALVGTGPAERALALPGGNVAVVDAGCCGMAGAFGYEAEHYDVSIAMAEHRLAPAVRAADARTVIAAAGFSCRSQIADTTGRTALHPAEILLGALAE